jgi:hypothetical protein
MTSPTPPTGRDFEIYRLRFVEGCSTREVAAAVRLSQTRVCQIANEVGSYLTAVAPANDAEARERQLTVAEQIASLRVSFLYGAALQSWRASQGT